MAEKWEEEILWCKQQLASVPEDQEYQEWRDATELLIKHLEKLRGRGHVQISLRCTKEELPDRIIELEQKGFEVDRECKIWEGEESCWELTIMYPEGRYWELAAIPGVQPHCPIT